MLSVDAGMDEPWGDVPTLPASRPPALGEHTDEIRASLNDGTRRRL